MNMEYRIREKVGLIELNWNKPEQDDLTAISYEFRDICNDLDKGILVLLILLKGKNFPHTTPNELKNGYAPSIVESAAGLDIPVIIGMDGCITGIALELALACDVRIATPGSSFGFTSIVHGHIPSNGGTQRLPRIVGKGKALEMILTGSVIDCEAAFDTGLVNRIAPSEELDTLSMELARNMSEKSAISMMYTKEAINKGMDMTLEQGIRLEADLYFLMHTTHDRSEGIRAFQEKRRPDFKGE